MLRTAAVAAIVTIALPASAQQVVPGAPLKDPRIPVEVYTWEELQKMGAPSFEDLSRRKPAELCEPAKFGAIVKCAPQPPKAPVPTQPPRP